MVKILKAALIIFAVGTVSIYAENQTSNYNSYTAAKRTPNGHFVFSLRPEFVAVTPPVIRGKPNTTSDSSTMADIYSLNTKNLKGTPARSGLLGVGGAVELGGISGNDFFLTGTAHYGAYYFGGFLNLGRYYSSYNKDFIAGITVGFSKMLYNIGVEENGVIIDNYTDENFNIGGGFIKLLFGGTHNFDFTTKILLGFRKVNFVGQETINDRHKVYRYYYDDESAKINKFSATFSLSVGYTLTTIRK